MSDIVQIRIGKNAVGIIGLKEALAEVAETMRGAPDEKIREELIARLSERNFISDHAIDSYGQAFLGEYKKFVGEPFAEENRGGIEIKVLGPGCPPCDRLEREVMTVMDETGIIADLDHVRDAKDIGRYGVMGTPALVINGEVKAVGVVPPRAKLKAWILRAANKLKTDGRG